MRLVQIALLIGVVGLGMHLCARDASPGNSSGEVVDKAGANGFVAMPALSGAPVDKVIVFAPKNCPSAAALRADAMARSLADRGVPIARFDRADFDFEQAPDAALMRRINTVMGGEMPVVFVNRRAKANPLLDEVVSEYRKDRQL